MWTRRIGACIVFAFVMAAPGSGQSGEPVAAGRQVYEARCQNCHMPNGEPVEAIEQALEVDMRDLASAEVQARSSDELRSDIVEGTGKMRPVANLESEAVANLLAYLRSLARE